MHAQSLKDLLEVPRPIDLIDRSVYAVAISFNCDWRELVAKKILRPGMDYLKIKTIESDTGIWVRRGEEFHWHWKLN